MCNVTPMMTPAVLSHIILHIAFSNTKLFTCLLFTYFHSYYPIARALKYETRGCVSQVGHPLIHPA